MKFLCAVTKKDDRYYQVLTEATLHNIPLRIIDEMCCSTFDLLGCKSRDERSNSQDDDTRGSAPQTISTG